MLTQYLAKLCHIVNTLAKESTSSSSSSSSSSTKGMNDEASWGEDLESQQYTTSGEMVSKGVGVVFDASDGIGTTTLSESERQEDDVRDALSCVQDNNSIGEADGSAASITLVDACHASVPSLKELAASPSADCESLTHHDDPTDVEVVNDTNGSKASDKADISPQESKSNENNGEITGPRVVAKDSPAVSQSGEINISSDDDNSQPPRNAVSEVIRMGSAAQSAPRSQPVECTDLEASENVVSSEGTVPLKGAENPGTDLQSTGGDGTSTTHTRAQRRPRRQRNGSNLGQSETSPNLSTSSSHSAPAEGESSTYAERVRRKVASYSGGMDWATSAESSSEFLASDTAVTHTAVSANAVAAALNDSQDSAPQHATTMSFPPPAPMGAEAAYAQRLNRKQSLDAPRTTTAENLVTPNSATASTADSHFSRTHRRLSSEPRMVDHAGLVSSNASVQHADSNRGPRIIQSGTQSSLTVNSNSGGPSTASIGDNLSEHVGNGTQSISQDGLQAIPSPEATSHEDWVKSAPTIAELNEGPRSMRNLARMSARNLSSPGMDEGDRFVASIFHGQMPSTNTNVLSVHPGAAPRHRAEGSFSFLPPESRGDFISGGQGPLVCDMTPGAFQAQGRAFGDLPAWFRNNSLPPAGSQERAALLAQLSTRSLPTSESSSSLEMSFRELRELRMSLGQAGSYIVRAQCQGSSSDEEMFNGLAVARARLIEKMVSSAAIIEESPGDLESSARQEVVNPENAAYEATALDDTAIPAAEQVTSEEVIRQKTTTLAFRYICGIIISLSLVLVTLIVAFTVSDSDDASMETIPPDHMAPFPRNESLPDRNALCSAIPNDIFDDFSPVVECYCGREIPGIPADIIKAHAHIVSLLLVNNVINIPPLATDCLDPKNVAILWMAEAEPEVESIEKTITRYHLAVLFHALNGLSWDDNSYWLTSRSECAWYGVVCDSDYLIRQIQLPENGLLGTIPSDVANFADLEIFNITENIFVTGEIPQELLRQSVFGTIEVDITGTSVQQPGGRSRA